MIKALVGLGNAGDEYTRTYHNVGAFVAEQIGNLATEASFKIYPLSGYMNESGAPVSRWLRLNNLGSDEFVVLHDDSDLAIGQYKLVRGGGSAGHKGIESLMNHLQTEDFWRLRIGVRNPHEVSRAGAPAQAPRAKAGEFVLTRWRQQEQEQFEAVAADVLPRIIAIS